MANENHSTTDDQDNSIPQARGKSGGSAFDDLTLTLEHVAALIQAIIDVEMSGEDRDLISLGTQARDLLESAHAICTANGQRWELAASGGPSVLHPADAGKGGTNEEPSKSVKSDIPLKAHDALFEAMLIVDGMQAVCFASLDGEHLDDVAVGLMRNTQGQLDQLDKKLSKLKKALRKGGA